MKIVVLDIPKENPGELDWSPLEKLGEVAMYTRTFPDQTVERIGDAGLVLINKTPLTREVFAACPQIRYVGVIATGFNMVDLAAAAERGITVTNVPSYGSEAIGQHAVALLLELSNRVGYFDREVRKLRRGDDSDWCFWDHPLLELAGMTMGIVGYGRIGQVTGRIVQALGMRVLACDTNRIPELENDRCRYADFEEVLRESDVIALHCPLFPETEGMIDRETIARMKDGVILINNSRGKLVVNRDLADALKSGKVAAAGLDVLEQEPPEADDPLLSAPNCVITPHISWAFRACRERLKNTAIGNLQSFLAGTPVNVVKTRA